jgi:hypothetical protein
MFLTGFTVLLRCTLPFLLFPVFVQSSPARGLIYSATADYRHDSIPVARDAITARGQSINVQFDATEDETRFTDADLASYDVLIFLMNTGEGSALLLAQWLSSSSSPPEADTGAVLDATGKAALQRYFDLGGNFVAIHSASDCLRNTTFYGREVGESRRVLLPIPALRPGTCVTDGLATSQELSLTLILRYKMRCV